MNSMTVGVLWASNPKLILIIGGKKDGRTKSNGEKTYGFLGASEKGSVKPDYRKVKLESMTSLKGYRTLSRIWMSWARIGHNLMLFPYNRPQGCHQNRRSLEKGIRAWLKAF